MIFSYECSKCNKRFEGEFPIGKAPRVLECPICNGEGKRIYSGMNIVFKINGHTSLSSNYGEQLKKKNEAAAYRMQGREAPKLLGYKYSDGSVKEA